MQRITIEIADDGRAAVTVEQDGAEPQNMDFETADQALEAVEQMLEPAEAEMADDEGGEMPSGDMAAMWDEEAAKRPKNPSFMA